MGSMEEQNTHGRDFGQKRIQQWLCALWQKSRDHLSSFFEMSAVEKYLVSSYNMLAHQGMAIKLSNLVDYLEEEDDSTNSKNSPGSTAASNVHLARGKVDLSLKGSLHCLCFVKNSIIFSTVELFGQSEIF